MKNTEIEILKNAIELKEQLGFKTITPRRNLNLGINSSWLSIRIDSSETISLAFSFNIKQLEKEGWKSEKLRVNLSSNGKIVILELDENGMYALSGGKNSNRRECRLTWQKDICKKPTKKEKFDIEYIPMNSNGVKRFVLNLPDILINNE